MKLSPIPQAIPTHVISGFLGAGKTTLLMALLAQKPEHETWAVLMNEFGQIGIDQQLLPSKQGYAVKELVGGCLCCSSQLPMQLSLSRLLSENQPHRLFIEPTGLGHPAQLLEQLTEPHWQAHLSVQSPVTVVNGAQLHQRLWLSETLYADQLKAAQMVVVSHADAMHEADHQALVELKQEYQAYAATWFAIAQGDLALAKISQKYITPQRNIQPLLQQQKLLPQQKKLATDQPCEVIQQLPYHYVETAQAYNVAGWKFSKRWQFDFYALLDLLCEQQDWRRIKAIFYTNQGWKSFNFNPQQFNYQSSPANIDNRIEIIYQNSKDDGKDASKDWQAFESALLACRIAEKN